LDDFAFRASCLIHFINPGMMLRYLCNPQHIYFEEFNILCKNWSGFANAITFTMHEDIVAQDHNFNDLLDLVILFLTVTHVCKPIRAALPQRCCFRRPELV